MGVTPGDRVGILSTTLAEDLAAALHRAVLERDAWPYVALEPPGLAADLYRHAHPRHRTEAAADPHGRGRRARRLRTDRGPGQHHRAGRRGPRGGGRGGDRPPAVSGGVAQAALDRHDPAHPGAGPAGSDEHGAVRRVRHPGALPGPAGPGPGLARSQRHAGGDGRAADPGVGDPHRGRGHRHPPRRRRSHLDQLRRPPQHAQRRGLHRAPRALGQRDHPFHRCPPGPAV